ncbi:MAG: DUF5777 family beta-barrel protein [Rhodothermales bacterium]
MKKTLRLLFVSLITLLYATTPEVTIAQEQESVAIEAHDLEAIEEQVAALFERSCTTVGCHAGPVPQMGMDLTRDQFYNAVVDKQSATSPDHKIIDPGNPADSYLLKKIRGEEGIVGMQMPMIGDKLTEEEIGTIEQWVTNLGDVSEVQKKTPVTKKAYPFYGWKVINLPTSRTLEAGNMLFLIGHRFNPKISDGYDAFYGLDGSGIIYMSLGYAIKDNFLVALARSNSADDVEFQARYGIIEQGGAKNWPIGVSLQTSVNFVSQKFPNKDKFARERFKTTIQMSLTRQLGDNIGLAVVPGILLNPAEDLDGEDQLITVGLGGRWRFTRTLSIIGEWVPIVSGFTRTLVFGNDIRYDSWGGGLEIATAGHVFQIVVTNAVGMTSDQYLRGGDLDVFEGDVRLGFNIFRVLN